MRYPLHIVGSFGFALLTILGQSVAKTKLFAPEGTLTGNMYVNDGLELKFKVPDGWVGTIDPTVALKPDSKNADSTINACSKVFLTIQVVKQEEGQFPSISQMMVIDPSCFPGVDFPKAVSKEDWNQAFMQVMVKVLASSPFMSAHGADVNAFVAGGRQFVVLSGDDYEEVNDHSVHVNHLMVFTESKGYWVAWMTRADDMARKSLERSNIQFLKH